MKSTSLYDILPDDLLWIKLELKRSKFIWIIPGLIFSVLVILELSGKLGKIDSSRIN